MTSRLDRLFILLESGSSAVTRRAAAKQIGEVQKLYPHELHALLNRLIGYLHSSSWDTRIAAAQTVEAILANVPAWRPELYAVTQLHEDNIKKEELPAAERDDEDDDDDAGDELRLRVVAEHEDDEASNSTSNSNSDSNTMRTHGHCHNNNHNKDGNGILDSKERLLSFAEFDVEQILHKGARLIGSEGNEFDMQDEGGGGGAGTSSSASSLSNSPARSAAERLSRQRALLNEKLGLTQASKLGIANLTDMITDEDMIVTTTRSGNSYNANEEKVPVEDILKFKPNAYLVPSNGKQLSCREMNRAKRKARQHMTAVSAAVSSTSTTVAVSRSKAASPADIHGHGHSLRRSMSSDEPPEKKKMKTESQQRQEIFYSLSDPVPDATGAWIDAISWPLKNFCARLYVDLFNPKWEVRHGAATALRELINSHAVGAGKSLSMTQEEMQRHHCLWLEDAALRLLCVLCLDRFGDFVSDQVVAPVRETCAQVLGTIVKEMDSSKVSQIVQLLLKLLKQKEWEVRHGGLLGLKYVFVVREDLLHVYLPQTISDILFGLFDAVDDVGAVAAATLIPVASWLPKLLNPTQVSSIVKMLWDLLLDQDELTSACNSFMGLLAAILCLPNASAWIQMEPMSTLVPRLWPFLSHSTSSVRKSTLVTLRTLTSQHVKLDNDAAVMPPVPAIVATAINTDVAVVFAADMNFDSKSLTLNFGVADWDWRLLQEALRHIYQRILVEPHADIQALAQCVWQNLMGNANLGALLHAACPFVSSWICLAMQPPRLAFDPTILIHAVCSATPAATPVAHPSSNGQTTDVAPLPPRRRPPRDDLCGGVAAGVVSGVMQRLFLGGNEATPLEVRERNYMRARIMAARVLGALSQYLVQPAPGVIYTPQTESPMDCYTKVLLGHLNSRSAVQRTVCALIIAFWAQADAAVCPGDPKLQDKLRQCVMEYVYYDEVQVAFTRLQQEAQDLIATLMQHKVTRVADLSSVKILTLDQIDAVATTLTADLAHQQPPLKPKLLDMLMERRRGLQGSYQSTSAEQCAYNVSTQAALAGAIVCLRCLPEKLNPVVKPLMESIKREECGALQTLSAEFLVLLMRQVSDRNPSPNSKILNNLCTLLRSDADFTPIICDAAWPLSQTHSPRSATSSCVYYGILTLSLQQNASGGYGTRGGTASVAAPPRGPGRPPVVEKVGAESNSNLELKQGRIQRLGATCAISKLCSTFGAEISVKIPVFAQLMFAKLEQFVAAHPSMTALGATITDLAQTNELVMSLQLIEVAAPHLDAAEPLQTQLFDLLRPLGVLTAHPLKAIRHMVARCIASLADIDACRTMHFVVDELVEQLRKLDSIIHRQGAVEAIERVVDKLQIKIVPYIVLLVVPLLGCMSDPDEPVRLLATHCFATLIQLMPLDETRSSGGKSYEIKSAALQARKTRDRQFLEYLFAPKTIPDFRVPVPLLVELRSYQQAGINWLWFLNKYNLHGILCDDMGLGKTLQTICILAGDHHQRAAPESVVPDLPSLVICPPTLTGHWVYEVDKFLNNSEVLRPLQYAGFPVGRERLRGRIADGGYNLVVASYDTVRKDIDFFSALHWNYVVLDEGHIIKNGKTKSSKAVKLLKANHRLILSGTPIQNNVLELWSLFDFLMPGFLGTERQFIARFSRPILASRDSKSSPKEQEAGVLAMEALHRQMLPFLLRRVKEDVLTDLPPKITQDLLCELSPLQERLYEDFSKTHLNANLQSCLESLGGAERENTKTHIFHALRYLQNVCNHPKLVLTPEHREYERITRELQQQKSSLCDIAHSAKLPALKQLLLDCGIGVQTESVSQHRALIFCQLKAMLDIVERDLLRNHMPTVSYLRLDGSVPASQRQDIVNNFNADPSIDVLLLTTQVGGLGLNLTGADTVIFVEHDWNPMRDLQAMDRAHRIGQKKVVNVYRLITRKSLEEKIMGLQKFKILTANTVVSAQNASMDTMATQQLFDLFNLNGKAAANSAGGDAAASSTTSTNMSMNAIIENLPELWSEHQYDEEYDLSTFMQGLKK